MLMQIKTRDYQFFKFASRFNNDERNSLLKIFKKKCFSENVQQSNVKFSKLLAMLTSMIFLE